MRKPSKADFPSIPGHHPSPTPEPTTAIDPTPHARHARLLVVDNEAPLRITIGELLRSEGYDVELASSGHEAATHLEQETFDLVLTDLIMPQGSGTHLLDLVHEEHPQLPVVVLSAIRDIDSVIATMRRGAYDYLLKPFSSDQLKLVVSRALEHRLALRQSHDYQQSLENIVRARTEMLRQAMKELEQSYDVTLEALGDALDLKDSETEGHSKRVTAYTIALARAMGLTPDEIKVISRGAFLHDIGKMAIPDHILRKPGRLTPEEQSLMREHCTRGYHILKKIPFLAAAASIVYSHQEHYDGRGYPSGLRGDEIPIGARIFAVADALDAITSDRPYRRAQSFEAARAEIARCSGTQFDPRVVEVFLAIPIELWQELRAEITGQNRRFLTVDLDNFTSSPQS